jgi:hypothetical protein
VFLSNLFIAHAISNIASPLFYSLTTLLPLEKAEAAIIWAASIPAEMAKGI